MIGFLGCLVWSLIDTFTSPWRKLIWWGLWLYFSCWRIAFTAAFQVLNAPFQALGAMRREQQLKEELFELQVQCKELERRRQDVETRLDFAVKDRQRLKEALSLALSEGKKSRDGLKALNARMQELESQFVKLNSLKEQEEKVKNTIMGSLNTSKLVYNNEKSQDMVVTTIHRNCWDETTNSLKPRLPVTGQLYAPAEIKNVGRGPAIASSVLSALLSALVGVIIYEAQDPCIPLVIALTMVVVMSLRNVIQFFSQLQNRFEYEAVALLSFNCFILGALAFPAFPRTAHFSSVVVMGLGKWVLSYFRTNRADVVFTGAD